VSDGPAFQDRPNPGVYWLILRWMAVISALSFLGYGTWGLWMGTLTPDQHAILMHMLEVFGYIALVYVALSQGATVAEAWLNRGSQ